MTINGRRALVLGLSMVVFAAGGARAEECTCAALPGGATNLANFKAAFAGRVQSVEAKDGQAVVTFEVVRSWKGSRAHTVAVTAQGGSCAAAFEKDKSYVVFANGDKSGLATNACAPNMDLAAASAIVRQLDRTSGYASNPLKVPTADPAAASASAAR